MHNSGQVPVELLSSSQVADALGGVHVSRVSRMVANGRLRPAFRAPGIRGAAFFHPDEVAAVVREEREALEARVARMQSVAW